MSTVQLNNVTVERGDGGLVTLQVEVAPETVRATRERVIKEYSRRIRVPGFRPGHIPANVVRRNVGDEAIAQAVSDELVPEAYQQALEQNDLQPLERAQVDQLTYESFTGDQPLQFTARVIVRPEMELGELKGLDVTRPVVDVTDEDVEQGLNALSEEHATLRNVEGRGAQDGDVLSAELSVFMDGEARSEEPAKLRAFVLGQSGFVPSIDEHLQGAQLDEERRFEVTYPEDFKDEELAGKAAEFAIKVTAIKERVLPEINDEFAKNLGLDDTTALRERMRQAIQEGREREAQDSVRSQVAAAAANATEFEVPTQLVESRTHNRIHNFEHELSHREATLDQYLDSIGQSREEFEAQVRGEIENELRQELVLDEIAKREALTANDQEIENHYLMVAQAMQRPVEEIVQQLDYQTVRASILQRKAVDWLLENATITEGTLPTLETAEDSGEATEASAEAEEKPKRARRKKTDTNEVSETGETTTEADATATDAAETTEA
jgi:trigger factor